MPRTSPVTLPVAGRVPGPSAFTGILIAIGGFFIFASCDAIIKSMTASYSIFQIMATQVVFSMIPVGVMLTRLGGLRSIRPLHPKLVAVRGVLSGLGSVCGYYAFAHLPLADAYAIVFGVPIMVTILSVPILGERVGIYRWSAVLVGFVGIMIMVRPSPDALTLGHLAAFCAMCGGSCVTLILRRIGRRERAPALVLSVVLGLCAVSFPVLPFVFTPPTWTDFGLMALAGLMMGIAQFVMLQAFRLAPAASVAPMQYTMMVWALLYGLFLFGDPIRPHVVAGAVVVMASSLYIVHRERKRGVHG